MENKYAICKEAFPSGPNKELQFQKGMKFPIVEIHESGKSFSIEVNKNHFYLANSEKFALLDS
jgi:hypothetical protein